MHTCSCIYTGHVYHRRVRPAAHNLRYRVFSLLLDLDELPQLSSSLWLFSHNRWNLFSFYDRDFGEQKNENLRLFVERNLRARNIKTSATKIRLLCYPRIFGYAFNPLSVYYCEDQRGELFAVLHEVHNTFGERHVYVLPVNHDGIKSADSSDINSSNETMLFHQRCCKKMHVSPFTPMRMQYQFRLNQPANQISLLISASDDNGLMLSASVVGVRRKLRDAALATYLFCYPLMTLKVIAGIHWEALRLWIKRVPWFAHQAKSS